MIERHFYLTSTLLWLDFQRVHGVCGEQEVRKVADVVLLSALGVDVDCVRSNAVLEQAHQWPHLVAADLVHEYEHLVLLRRAVFAEDMLRRL